MLPADLTPLGQRRCRHARRPAITCICATASCRFGRRHDTCRPELVTQSSCAVPIFRPASVGIAWHDHKSTRGTTCRGRRSPLAPNLYLATARVQCSSGWRCLRPRRPQQQPSRTAGSTAAQRRTEWAGRRGGGGWLVQMPRRQPRPCTAASGRCCARLPRRRLRRRRIAGRIRGRIPDRIRHPTGGRIRNLTRSRMPGQARKRLGVQKVPRSRSQGGRRPRRSPLGSPRSSLPRGPRRSRLERSQSRGRRSRRVMCPGQWSSLQRTTARRIRSPRRDRRARRRRRRRRRRPQSPRGCTMAPPPLPAANQVPRLPS